MASDGRSDWSNRCACGRRIRPSDLACQVCNSSMRTWAEVARIYRQRSGEQISDGSVKQTGLLALRKLRIALEQDAFVREELGLGPLPEAK